MARHRKKTPPRTKTGRFRKKKARKGKRRRK